GIRDYKVTGVQTCALPILLETVGRETATLVTQVKISRVAASAGMIIQSYDFVIREGSRTVYRGETMFGFFTPAALAQQVGLRDRSEERRVGKECSSLWPPG